MAAVVKKTINNAVINKSFGYDVTPRVADYIARVSDRKLHLVVWESQSCNTRNNLHKAHVHKAMSGFSYLAARDQFFVFC
jgi:hypothetical protein